MLTLKSTTVLIVELIVGVEVVRIIIMGKATWQLWHRLIHTGGGG